MPSGVYIRTKENCRNIAKGMKDNTNAKGCIHSEEAKKKNSESNKGKIPWNKGKHTGIAPWNKGLTGVYSEESRRKNSEAIKKKWQDPEYREKQLPNLLRNNNDAYGKSGEYKDTGIIMRSDFERWYVDLFDKFIPILWRYEILRIVMANGHVHIVDIYFPDINLIIEIKPKRFIHDKETQYKKNQAIKQGYDYWFAHEKNPKKTIEHILKLMEIKY